ncbi:MAG: DoxX family protein [Planctomycetaceae bacterium]|nr:DoxX family protein [Planctomycetaceae bacterium]
MLWSKTASKVLLAVFLIFAGMMHFVKPGFFLKIMPPYLPLHKELVLVSGLCEILLGVALLVPRWSCWAAWGAIALFIAVFPANIYLYKHQEILPAPAIVHLLRLPLQGVFILWAFWHTR